MMMILGRTVEEEVTTQRLTVDLSGLLRMPKGDFWDMNFRNYLRGTMIRSNVCNCWYLIILQLVTASASSNDDMLISLSKCRPERKSMSIDTIYIGINAQNLKKWLRNAA